MESGATVWDLKKIALVIIILVVCLAGIGSCTSSGGSSRSSGGKYTTKCKSCGRSYSAGDSAGNYKNIARTGMCNNCYTNFKSVTNALNS